MPVCPEVELGLGVPRETLRVERGRGRLRLLMPAEDRDLTADMTAFARARVRELAAEDLNGYVLKKSSPSCGLERVKVYREGGGGARSHDGRGLFAEELVARFPLLPVEEEGRLVPAIARL